MNSYPTGWGGGKIDRSLDRPTDVQAVLMVQDVVLDVYPSCPGFISTLRLNDRGKLFEFLPTKYFDPEGRLIYRCAEYESLCLGG
jgi:hypothetical protein